MTQENPTDSDGSKPSAADVAKSEAIMAERIKAAKMSGKKLSPAELFGGI